MKLPDQPSAVSTTTSTALGAGLSKEPGKTNTEEGFFGGAVSDVTVAAADSTTLGMYLNGYMFIQCYAVSCNVRYIVPFWGQLYTRKVVHELRFAQALQRGYSCLH